MYLNQHHCFSRCVLAGSESELGLGLGTLLQVSSILAWQQALAPQGTLTAAPSLPAPVCLDIVQCLPTSPWGAIRWDAPGPSLLH